VGGTGRNFVEGIMLQMIFFLFGLLGAGKNFVAKVFEQEFGFIVYDADQDLTPGMRDAIADHREFTEQMRDEYVEIVIRRIAELRKSHPRLVIAQALFKNRNRLQIHLHFPEIKDVWVQADPQVIGKRLDARKDHLASKSYAKLVNHLFEIPSIPYEVLVNNTEREEVVEQIARLLAKYEGLNYDAGRY
jgi:gluconate kinase